MSTVKHSSNDIRTGKGRVDPARIARISDAEREAMRAASGIDDSALSPPRDVVPKLSVRRLRESLGLSQSEFARRFGLSSRTVQQWEQRRSVPEGPAQVLLRLIEDDPDRVARAVSGLPGTPPHQPGVSFALGFPDDTTEPVGSPQGVHDPFTEYILDRDDFRAVVVGHAHLETIVERLIEARLTHADVFQPRSSLRSDGLVALAVALAAIDTTTAAALRAVASIRDHFVHRLAGRPSRDLVQSLIADVSRIPGARVADFADTIERDAAARGYGTPLTTTQISLRAAIAALYEVLLTGGSAR